MLTVGDRVTVRVLSVDVDKKRIALTMKSSERKEAQRPKNDQPKREATQQIRPQPKPKKEEPLDLESMLNLLKNKYAK